MTGPRKKKRKPPAAAPGAARASLSAAEFEALIKQTNSIQKYLLTLYITGTTVRSAQAITNVRSLCDEFLAGRYELEVVDVYQQPEAARDAQIIAAPTLVKKSPAPPKRLVGDLSDRDRVIIGLDLRPHVLGGDKPPTQWISL